MTQAGTYI
ncbi:hypothetical protein CGLO_11913 [Colletotrichum gloeosporioides Cg-14]|uniref:Uncharacterized protein n=1 Tax=Colletotrichum gloeosporioides (strain Cg-14) TaxID=1237896 RepID=T0K780_COLGC|nr:hypothetical protein CGLO_11913 [Colletotrichum gloeosporioides Cg-14]